MNEKDFLAELRGYIAKHYITRAAAAKAWGFSTAYVSAITTGRKPPPDWLIEKMGYKRERVVTETYAAIGE